VRNDTFSAIIIIIVLFVFTIIVITELRNRKPSEALVLEAAAVKFCNELHYPVDLNIEEWKDCLKEFEK